LLLPFVATPQWGIRADQNGTANEPLAFKAIQAAIVKATEIRNRKYEAIECFSITFEADDSGAEGDVQSFRMIAEDILGASFTHLRISAKTKNVGLKIQDWMVPILGGRPSSKNLIIIHYAGHGAIS
jgi:hypothetical protein